MTTFYYGPVINPQSLTDYLALPRCLIRVSAEGDIDRIYEDVQSSQLQEILAQNGYTDLSASNFIELKEGEFLMPGFIDTHTHACQVPNLGVGGEFELLQWLDNYTFPTEARFKDAGYAERAYPDVVQRIVNSGTTTCCYYGSLHLEATKILAKLVHDRGQRAFVGKCNMNRNCPPNYIEPSVNESIDTTLALIKYIEELPKTSNGQPLVHPILTPRFAISCTEELLTRVSEIALKNPKLAIQTHISENPSEVELTKSLFNADSYAQVYERYHLLRNNTILAHGVHLTEDEMVLIAKHGAGVSHCPTSNFYLSSGMARVGMLLDHGVKVGLGTDVAGGYSPSILSTIQHASIASKMLAIQAAQAADKKRNCSRHRHRRDEEVDSESSDEVERHSHGHHGHHGHGHKHHHHEDNCDGDEKKPGGFTNERLSIAALLYLATLGGAHVCCLQDRIGSFAEKKAFDALLVSVRDETGNPGVWGYNITRDLTDGVTAQSADKSMVEWLERFLFCGDDRNIRRVIVQGKMIGGQEYQH
ncbi:Metallo-dependent hydrolase [Rhizopogon vinicolor AM-OR11-026]|uniref:Probable guanine deaminase n=1 Tax=Rhizopogon vinicolor AM-OR11-026 TaxID=1314800 RepID=A0A1B7NAW5_9AGAM|nr:Metallo-dependent hydrolase [Rhizopogon vinicolor AM-OR11-026]